jgi:hypothetical protein
VVAFENKLYVDTRSPLFGAVLDAPPFVFNLNDNNLENLYITKGSYYLILTSTIYVSIKKQNIVLILAEPV